MAPCDQGYLCDVCGDDVEEIFESDLYLRYVIGEIDAQSLVSSPERHLRCNPVQAQFIVDDEFPPVRVDGDFAKRHLDPDDVRRREELVTRGWRRLNEVQALNVAIGEYPLPEVKARQESRSHVAGSGGNA